MEQFVEHIAATENAIPIGGLTDQQRAGCTSRCTRRTSRCTTRPTIEDDQGTQSIAPDPAAAELTPYPDTPPEGGIP